MNPIWNSPDLARLVDEDEEASAGHPADERSPTAHPQHVDGRGHRLRVVALGGLASGVLVLLAIVGTIGRMPSPTRSEGAREGRGVVELGMLDLVVAAASGASTAARIVEDGRDGYKQINKVYDQISKPEQEAAQEILKEAPSKNLTQHFAHLHGKQLYPKNDMNDDNQCPDTEELFGGLCYSKCVDLTQGRYPIRSTAFSCCQMEPCSFFNTKFTSPLKYCSGLDVAGPAHNTNCPHQPGDCLANEEFNLGLCYKKCSLLTNNEYPFRFGAHTCCKYRNHLACLDPLNVVTTVEFNVGGGQNDTKLGGAAGASHTPMPALAEVQTTTTLLAVPAVAVV